MSQRNQPIFKCVIAAISICIAFCSCGVVGNKMNAMADEAAQKFNTMVQNARTAEDARHCVSFYKTMEMDFVKFSVKYNIETPLARYRAQTSSSLAKLEKEFKATMIPTQTSMNLCKAIAHGASKRGMRTMIVSVMIAYRYAVFSKRNAMDNSPTRKIATAYATKFASKNLASIAPTYAPTAVATIRSIESVVHMSRTISHGTAQ